MGPPFSRSRSVSPSSSSDTMKGVASSVPMSNTARMLGWLSAAAARASCSNRRRRSTSAEPAVGSTLIATSRPRRGSRARYTSPIPPAPIADTISYGPRRAPGCSGTGMADNYRSTCGGVFSRASRQAGRMNLQNKTALVTGGTKGIGGGVARELAERGARVFATGRSADEAVAGHARLTFIRCDHREDADAERLFERLRGEAPALDILVNAVWGGYERMMVDGEFTWSKPFWEQPLWRWDAMFAAGVRAYYRDSQLAARAMVTRQSGLIVNISHWAAQKHIGNVA